MTPQPMWPTGDYLLRRRVAAAYSTNSHVAAAIVGGSVSRGHADRFSDIEVGVFWHQPPTDAERLASAEATGGDVQRIYPYEPEEEVWEDNLFLGHVAAGQRSTGVLVEVVHNTTEFIERMLDDVLVHYDPSEFKQNLMAAFIHAVPVYGEALIEFMAFARSRLSTRAGRCRDKETRAN